MRVSIGGAGAPFAVTAASLGGQMQQLGGEDARVHARRVGGPIAGSHLRDIATGGLSAPNHAGRLCDRGQWRQKFFCNRKAGERHKRTSQSLVTRSWGREPATEGDQGQPIAVSIHGD